VSVILQRPAVKVCPAVLNSLSTAALLAGAALYFRNAAAMLGNTISEAVSVEWEAVDFSRYPS